MSLGTEVNFGPGNIVLDGVTAAPTFRPMSILAKWLLLAATAELLLYSSRQTVDGYIGATW